MRGRLHLVSDGWNRCPGGGAEDGEVGGVWIGIGLWDRITVCNHLHFTRSTVMGQTAHHPTCAIRYSNC